MILKFVVSIYVYESLRLGFLIKYKIIFEG